MSTALDKLVERCIPREACIYIPEIMNIMSSLAIQNPHWDLNTLMSQISFAAGQRAADLKPTEAVPAAELPWFTPREIFNLSGEKKDFILRVYDILHAGGSVSNVLDSMIDESIGVAGLAHLSDSGNFLYASKKRLDDLPNNWREFLTKLDECISNYGSLQEVINLIPTPEPIAADPEAPKAIYKLPAEAKNWFNGVLRQLMDHNGHVGSVSDGYHTYDELYQHRSTLFIAMCNKFPNISFKSKWHHDPNFPMYEGMFICGIMTPGGWATYHCDTEPYWNLLDVPVYATAPEFDGHTPNDVLNRIGEMWEKHRFSNAITRDLAETLGINSNLEMYVRLNTIKPVVKGNVLTYEVPVSVAQNDMVTYNPSANVAVIHYHPGAKMPISIYLGTNIRSYITDGFRYDHEYYADKVTMWVAKYQTDLEAMFNLGIYQSATDRVAPEIGLADDIVMANARCMWVMRNGGCSDDILNASWMTMVFTLYDLGYSGGDVQKALISLFDAHPEIWPWDIDPHKMDK